MKQDTELSKKNKTPPVKIGEDIIVKVTGIGDKDPFVNYEGFIIFIKKMPQEEINNMAILTITSIKQTYGFADYKGRA